MLKISLGILSYCDFPFPFPLILCYTKVVSNEVYPQKFCDVGGGLQQVADTPFIKGSVSV